MSRNPRLTDTRIVIDDIKNPVTSLLHVVVGTDAAEHWRSA